MTLTNLLDVPLFLALVASCMTILAFLSGMVTSARAERLGVRLPFFQHADYSGFTREWHTIGVTGLLVPGLSCSAPRSFHKRPLGFGMKYLSQKEAFFATPAC